MLSTEEMRKRIENYCYERENCSGCPLKNLSGSSCYTDVSLETIEENYDTLVNAGYIKNEIQEQSINKHLNGYIFDSLMYRYQLARERQLMYEIAKESIEPKTARDRFNRDLMRFGQILDEAMGEHD